MKCFSVIILACSIGSTALAQTPQSVTTAVLNRDPTTVLNRPIRVAKLGCFYATETGYRCTTYGGAYVLLQDIAPGAIKTAIKDGCGGIVEAEDDPTCLFDIVFTPLSVGKGTGDIVKGDESIRGPIWMVRAATGTATLHR